MKFVLCSMVAVAEASRVNVNKVELVNTNPFADLPEKCRCTETGIVNGVTMKKDCGVFFGPRFGPICYIEGGLECAGAKFSKKSGVHWRACPNELKAQVAKQNLLEVLEGMDVAAIKEMAAPAKELGVDAKTLALADSRCERIDQMMKVKEELFEALQGFDHARLVKLAEQAEEYELFEFLPADMPKRIEDRGEYLLLKDEKEQTLREAMRGVDYSVLDIALNDAKTVKANPTLLVDGEAALKTLAEKLEATEEALSKALKSIDVAEIQAAIKDAEYFKIGTHHELKLAKGRIKYLNAINGPDLHIATRKHQKALAKKKFPDMMAMGAERLKEIGREYMYLKLSVQKLAKEGTDADEIERQTALCEQLRACSNQLIAQAKKKATELRR